MENSSVICGDITDICVESFKPTAFFSLNVFSVIFNILNLASLKKLDLSKRNAYFWIVVNIEICEIVTCLTFSLAISCQLNRKIVTLPLGGARIFQVTVTIFSAVSFVAKNFVLAIGSYGRYISICFPYQIDTNKITSNIKLCLGLVWITSSVLMTIVIGTYTKEYCFGEFGAIPAKPNMQASVAFLGSIITALLAFAICLPKTWREFKRMQLRSAASAQDDLVVKRSAQYIIVASIAHYLSYLPTVVLLVCNNFDDIPNSLVSSLRWISYFYMTMYSIFNVVFYIFMTPGYRVHVMNLLRLKKTAIQPN